MFALQKQTLSFERHNKQFANYNCDNLKCLPPTFAHAHAHAQAFANRSVKLITALFMASRLNLFQITCIACLRLATDFTFVESCQ